MQLNYSMIASQRASDIRLVEQIKLIKTIEAKKAPNLWMQIGKWRKLCDIFRGNSALTSGVDGVTIF